MVVNIKQCALMLLCQILSHAQMCLSCMALCTVHFRIISVLIHYTDQMFGDCTILLK